jgi:hypothetical protein
MWADGPTACKSCRADSDASSGDCHRRADIYPSFEPDPDTDTHGNALTERDAYRPGVANGDTIAGSDSRIDTGTPAGCNWWG